METPDEIQTPKIMKMTPTWGEKRVALWEVETTGGIFRIESDQINPPPECLIIVRQPQEATFWPTKTCSIYYTPIPHQVVQEYFFQAVQNRYPGVSPQPHPYVRERNRMIALYDIGEKVAIPGHNELLHFQMCITNSYDLSLGITVDAYLWDEQLQVGFFLALAGKWAGTFKHYWTKEVLQTKLNERIGKILSKKDERIASIQKFATIFIMPEVITDIGRALNTQKREFARLQQQGETQIGCEWVKNAGFTCTELKQPMTAWQALMMFAGWSNYVSPERKIDIAQQLYVAVEYVLDKHHLLPQ
jgi:hypothetical protein